MKNEKLCSDLLFEIYTTFMYVIVDDVGIGDVSLLIKRVPIVDFLLLIIVRLNYRRLERLSRENNKLPLNYNNVFELQTTLNIIKMDDSKYKLTNSK